MSKSHGLHDENRAENERNSDDLGLRSPVVQKPKVSKRKVYLYRNTLDTLVNTLLIVNTL